MAAESMTPWEVMVILDHHERRVAARMRLQHEAQLQRERGLMVFALALGEMSRTSATALRALNLTIRELDLTLKEGLLELSEQLLRGKRPSDGVTPASGRNAKTVGRTRAERRGRASVSPELGRANSTRPGAR